MEKGNLSIHSENILPIIKRWLYSDMDIFVREMTSNAVDAITKLKKLVDMGEVNHISKDEEYKISVRIDKENKAIIFEDNGIGMTSDEVKEYINQIAFSGANAFIEKYKEKADTDGGIIGHFGLGFYSSFMVSNRVQIDTLSYLEQTTAVKWECEGGIEYSMSDSTRTIRGTAITLYVNEDGEEFLEEFKLKSVLLKYCGYVPVPIFVESSEEAINDISPLWLKPANECTDEEYKTFYSKAFTDFNEPLFWIHLNMDYPFRLKGILYFPRLKHDLEYIEGQVKLYNNQVFIADNIKEVIPEYLLLLKGVMDCPDLPLNVSRSFLQFDTNVRKMSGYISKKVADKLNSLCKKDREIFNGYWDDIAPFIKYGCIKEKDFYEKVKSSVLYRTIDGEHMTLTEFTDKTNDKTVFYVSNEQIQSQYIKLFKEQGLSAVILATNLDAPFISYLETYETDIKFKRIDSDLTESLKQGDSTENEEVQAIFRKHLNNEKLIVKIEALKSQDVSAVILLSEQSRRMQEMSKMFGQGMPNMFEEELTLVLNGNHNIVKQFIDMTNKPEKDEHVELITLHLFDLAMLSHKTLPTDQMTKFIERSNKLLGMLN